MKAQTEGEVLQHMNVWMGRHGKMSGALSQWAKAKVAALDFIWRHCADEHGAPPANMLDIGVGDMAHLEQWSPFKRRALEYVGVDGSIEVLKRARAQYPDLPFTLRTFSQVVQNHGPVADLVVALDVFYHIQDDVLHDNLRRWVFEHADHYVLLSHATDMGQKFELGLRPGDPGFAWFPRPFTVPDGWQVLHQADCTEGAAAQRLLVLGRVE